MAKRYYESYIILDGNYEDSQVDEIVKRYETFLKDHGAEVKQTEMIGRKRLAYPIKKRLNGFYVCYEFLSEPDFIKELETKYRVDDEILRYLTVIMDEKTRESRDRHFKRKAEEAAKAEAESQEEGDGNDNDEKSSDKTRGKREDKKPASQNA